MHSEIAPERNAFDFDSIAQGVAKKLIRRHPHVYGDVDAKDPDEVARAWEQQKLSKEGRTSIFDGMPKSIPALQRAERVQQKAGALGFDWPDISGVWAKIVEELGELREAVADEPAQSIRIADELGDLLFSVVNLARHLQVEPEKAMQQTTNRFISRFKRVEELAGGSELIANHTIEELEELWERAKSEEKVNNLAAIKKRDQP